MRPLTPVILTGYKIKQTSNIYKISYITRTKIFFYLVFSVIMKYADACRGNKSTKNQISKIINKVQLHD